MELAIHEQMPLYASGAVFVHAGVVGWQGRALLLPGSSYTGKSTLTHALIRLGAEYYSDEYAVIQNNGELVPYRRRLTLRGESGAESRLAIDSALSPDHESTIRLVAFCPYVQGSRWQPAESSPGQGVLGLFSHTVTAQLSPNRDLNWLRLGSQHARFLKSERGEAEIVAVELLKLLEQQP
ncbi:hypothetical protein IV102_19780 [bacterium]|nr:hypothetical protein [bacterium]